MTRVDSGIPPVKGNHARLTREAPSSVQFIEFVRQTCNGFTALRRGSAFLGENDLLAAIATIGCHSVFSLLYWKNQHDGNRQSSASAGSRLSGYRTAQHLLGLAQKFNHPIVVFTTSETSLQCASMTEPHQAHGVSNLILSQSRLETPIILALLGRWSCGDVFGAWLADKVLAVDRTRFSMTIPSQDHSFPIQAGAAHLLRHGVIDQTVPPSSNSLYDSRTTMPEAQVLNAALSKLLDEVSRASPQELMIQRKEKNERISRAPSTIFGLGERIKMLSSNGSIASI